MSKLKDQLKAILPGLAKEANQVRDPEIRERFEFIKAVVNSKKDVTKACAARGRSTDFFNKWGKRLIKQKSLTALKPKTRAPKRQPRKTPKRVVKRIIQLRKAQPFQGPERIHFDLKKLFNIKCPASTIAAVLKRSGLITTEHKKRLTKRHLKRYRRPFPGYGQMDVKYVPYLVEEAQLYQFNFVDHCTTWRFTRIYPNLTHESVGEFLSELESNLPFPLMELQTDNGGEFTDKYRNGRLEPSGQHVVDQWCKKHNITHRLIPPGKKELNGKVENTHKQDDREFYSQNDLRSLTQARLLIRSYNGRWNEQRATKALGWLTPNETIAAAYVRMLAWLHLICEKYELNKNSIIKYDAEMNAYVEAKVSAKAKKRPSTRRKKSLVNRYLQYHEWHEKKSAKIIFPVPPMSLIFPQQLFT